MWAEVLDPATNRHYYHNSISGESSWENPEEADEPPHEALEWAEVADAASGRSYWHNSITGESTWTDPGLANSSAAQQPAIAAVSRDSRTLSTSKLPGAALEGSIEQRLQARAKHLSGKRLSSRRSKGKKR